MEPSLQEQQPQPQPQQEQAWRGEETEVTSAAEDYRHRILSKAGLKVPVGTMNARAMLLTDLLGKFKPSKANLHGDCCQESIKDRFHFVKKRKARQRSRESFLYRRYRPYDAALDNLVSQMKSPGFAIQQNQSEVDVNHSFVRFSLYDKTPREPLPQINISEANSPENRPDMTQKFENCSIASEPHKISADMDTFQQ